MGRIVLAHSTSYEVFNFFPPFVFATLTLGPSELYHMVYSSMNSWWLYMVFGSGHIGVRRAAFNVVLAETCD
jgi:hypothetical protein